MTKFARIVTFRMDEKRFNRLIDLSEQEGLSKSDYLRLIFDHTPIENIDKIIQVEDEKKLREKDLIGSQLYLANLLKNATNNLNQIAKKVNQNPDFNTNEINQNIANTLTEIERISLSIKSKSLD